MRLLALALLLVTSVAGADSRLAATPDELHRERIATRERAAAKLLTALPSVERVELSLRLPNPFAEPLDAPATAPSATVVLVGSASRDDVVRILRSQVHDLAAERITLLQSAPKATSEPSSFVQIGPFRVHPSSASSLRAWLAISLLANVFLAGIVLSRLRAA